MKPQNNFYLVQRDELKEETTSFGLILPVTRICHPHWCTILALPSKVKDAGCTYSTSPTVEVNQRAFVRPADSIKCGKDEFCTHSSIECTIKDNKLVPHRARVLVKEIKSDEKTLGGIIITDINKIASSGKGEVVAVGDLNEDVKVGDIIQYDPLEATTIEFNNERFLSLKEQNIHGVYVNG